MYEIKLYRDIPSQDVKGTVKYRVTEMISAGGSLLHDIKEIFLNTREISKNTKLLV